MTTMRSPGAAPEVPDSVQRGLHIRRERRASRWRRRRRRPQPVGRRDEAVLMRMQAEDRPAAPLRRALLDDADGAIAVFHREGKIPLLHRRAHARIFRRRHASFEDETFGAAADRAPLRGDEGLAGSRRTQRLGSDARGASLFRPESAGQFRSSTIGIHLDPCCDFLYLFFGKLTEARWSRH